MLFGNAWLADDSPLAVDRGDFLAGVFFLLVVFLRTDFFFRLLFVFRLPTDFFRVDFRRDVDFFGAFFFAVFFSAFFLAAFSRLSSWAPSWFAFSF